MGRKVWFAFAAVLLGASSAQSEPVTFRFDGTVTGAHGLEGNLAAGQGFSVLATWDTARPGFDLSGGLTDYDRAYDRLELSIGSHTYTLNRPNAGVSHLHVFDDYPGRDDSLSMYLELGYGWFDGPQLTDRRLSPWYFELLLSFPDAAWDSTAPPSALPATPTFSRGAVYWTDPDQRQPIAGRGDVSITSVHKIPEPATLTLLALGAGAAFMLRRRRR